jgi:hypothetical protein
MQFMRSEYFVKYFSPFNFSDSFDHILKKWMIYFVCDVLYYYWYFRHNLFFLHSNKILNKINDKYFDTNEDFVFIAIYVGQHAVVLGACK